MKKPMMTTRELSEAGVTRIVMPSTKNKTTITAKILKRNIELENEKLDLERANQVLRSAMYDIVAAEPHDSTAAECATHALEISALDKNGRLASPSNS